MTNSQELLIEEMKSCEQTKGQSVYDHGISVKNHFDTLLSQYKEGQLSSNDNWRIPNWFIKYSNQIINNLHDINVCEDYMIFHDCGKKNVRTIDSDGKVHFPNHAEASKEVYFKLTGDEVISNLIGWDMIIHQETSDSIQNYCENVWSIKDAITLLLASLCEIHSNAELFGGIISTSFKQKWKTIDRRGNQICKYFFEGKL